MFLTWTREEENFLAANYENTPVREISEHLGKPYLVVKGKAFRMGLRRNTFRWTPEMIAELRELYPNTQTKTLAEKFNCSITGVQHKANDLGVKKSAEFLSSDASGRISKYNDIGKAGRYKKGHVPWSKGKKVGTRGRAGETQWKKGNRPHNMMRVGDIALTTDGYYKKKIAEPNKWRFLHCMIWEEVHGVVPKGMMVIFKDNNPKNCVLENLECITRAEHISRHRMVNHYPEDVRAAIHALGALKRTINRRNENAEK